jgi:hypothetical protein
VGGMEAITIPTTKKIIPKINKTFLTIDFFFFTIYIINKTKPVMLVPIPIRKTIAKIPNIIIENPATFFTSNYKIFNYLLFEFWGK